MSGRSGLALAGALLVLFLAGCSATEQQPLRLADWDGDGRLDLRRLDLDLGARIEWRGRDGETGRGRLLAVRGDTLVVRELLVVERRPLRRERCIALADLVELRRYDARGEPYLGMLIGVPLIMAVTFLVLLGVAWDGSLFGG